MSKFKPAGLRSLKKVKKVDADGGDGFKKLFKPLVVLRKVFGFLSFLGHAFKVIDYVKDLWDNFF